MAKPAGEQVALTVPARTWRASPGLSEQPSRSIGVLLAVCLMSILFPSSFLTESQFWSGICHLSGFGKIEL